jgi:hypothetical protein
MLPKRLVRLPLERRLSPPTEQPITSARRLHLCSERLIIVALSLWLTGCNSQQPAAYSLPAPEVTVSKPEQKEVVNWNEFTGRTAAVNADSTRLTTIVSIDPIYAYFSVDELAALSYQRLIREGKVASSQDGKVPVYLQLQDETGFPHEGTIDFSDNAFDSSTGTLLIRGSFPNPDGFLTPGNFVRVRVASSPKYDALLVADRAIGSDQDQSFVYVVDSKNIARLRHVKTGQLAEGLRVVKSGLQPDDVVIINGIIKVRPDSPVKPQPGAMEQFSSNDISMPLISSQSSASHAGTGR